MKQLIAYPDSVNCPVIIGFKQTAIEERNFTIESLVPCRVFRTFAVIGECFVEKILQKIAIIILVCLFDFIKPYAHKTSVVSIQGVFLTKTQPTLFL